MRQLSQHSSDNFDLEPPAGRTDPLLRQLNKNENIKVQNLQPPPQRLTNIFEAMGGAKRVSFPGATVKVCENNLNQKELKIIMTYFVKILSISSL